MVLYKYITIGEDAMTCYLVDYENVNQSGLSGIEHLNKGEKVIIYYSEKANLNLKFLNEISQSNAEIEYRKITCAKKSALDFILVCDLGMLIAQNSYDLCCIVSNDKDYDNVMAYINCNYDCSVKKVKAISQNIFPVNEECNPTYKIIRDIFNELSEDCVSSNITIGDIIDVQNIIDTSPNKFAVNNALVRRYGVKGDLIYEKIQPLLKGKKF